jgi:glycosyltransferase involved in cell wall biosynthesis
MTATLPSIELSDGTDVLRRAAGRVESIDSAEGSKVDRPFASIVMPYYNPGDRLRATVEHLVHVLDASGMSFEVITVSDGSTDGSPFTLDEFPESIVRRVSYATNVGKGHALRTGLAMARGRYVGFIDADGDISPEFMASFVSVMHAQEPDIIIGSKRHLGSSVHWTPLRRLCSWGHQWLIHRLFRLDVKDTQVGIKLMHRRVVTDVLPLLRESRFAFDLELLVLARYLGYTRILEAPVRIEERIDSTISLKRAWRLFVDTLGLYVRLSVRHEYDAPIAFRSTGSASAAAESQVGTTRAAVAPSPMPA